MLVRLVIFFTLIVAATWGWTVVSRRRRLRPSPIPDRWRLVAAAEPRLEEALRMREQLAELSVARDNAVGADLIVLVDELVEAVTETVELRLALQRHLSVLDRRVLERDSEFLPPERVKRQRALLQAARGRTGAMDEEIASAVADLREMYLFAVDHLRDPGLGEQGVVTRTRERAARLRTRLQAERELKEALGEEVE